MNGTQASLASLVNALVGEFDDGLEPPRFRHCETLVFPPFVYLAQVAERLQGTTLKLGAQDVDSREAGAVTGGIAAAMLKDVGCQFVLVGHSERRTLFGEDNAAVARKFAQCIAHELCPILCVGESLEQRNAGVTLEVVREQLEFVSHSVGVAQMGRAMVAYEPVWAIGTGASATPAEVESVHANIRACLAEIDAGLGASIRLLYGGSVTPENASALVVNANVDGVLAGGASLSAEGFLEICQAAEDCS